MVVPDLLLSGGHSLLFSSQLLPTTSSLFMSVEAAAPSYIALVLLWLWHDTSSAPTSKTPVALSSQSGQPSSRSWANRSCSSWVDAEQPEDKKHFLHKISSCFTEINEIVAVRCFSCCFGGCRLHNTQGRWGVRLIYAYSIRPSGRLIMPYWCKANVFWPSASVHPSQTGREMS